MWTLCHGSAAALLPSGSTNSSAVLSFMRREPRARVSCSVNPDDLADVLVLILGGVHGLSIVIVYLSYAPLMSAIEPSPWHPTSCKTARLHTVAAAQRWALYLHWASNGLCMYVANARKIIQKQVCSTSVRCLHCHCLHCRRVSYRGRVEIVIYVGVQTGVDSAAALPCPGGKLKRLSTHGARSDGDNGKELAKEKRKDRVKLKNILHMSRWGTSAVEFAWHEVMRTKIHHFVVTVQHTPKNMFSSLWQIHLPTQKEKKKLQK